MASGDFTAYSDVAVRVGSTPITADSATFTTTEVSLVSVTFTQALGVTYAINVQTAFSSTVTGTEIVFARVREDTLTGNQLQGLISYMPTAGSSGYPISMYCEYTAASTGSKTIVLTAVRSSGTGTYQLRAGSNHPGAITVTKIVT